jgi:predicted alpha/beta-fold hydrolase
MRLDFQPLLGISSRHLQTIIPAYRSPGKPPLSTIKRVPLERSDQLACEISQPSSWSPSSKTVVLVHGLGGSASSGYMIRMARKLYAQGIKVVRVNSRGCGEGKGLSSRPYYAGASHDLLLVISSLKNAAPSSPIVLIGFSLGGNIALKLAGELGEPGRALLSHVIAVCAPLDLEDTVKRISAKKHALYHAYYLKNFSRQITQWIDHKVHSLYELDDTVIAPAWGYKNAEEYYEKCSSLRFLKTIQVRTDLLFAEDDPFIDFSLINGIELPKAVHVWTTRHGGHMGFIGKTAPEHYGFWLDQLLLDWVARSPAI